MSPDSNVNSDEEDDEFHDAFETLTATEPNEVLLSPPSSPPLPLPLLPPAIAAEGIAVTEMTLDRAIIDSQIAIQYFFNNQFHDARNLLEPWSKTSIYHGLGTCVFSCLEAVLTFKHEHIARASNLLKDCMLLCQKLRKKKSFGDSLTKMIRKSYYNSYTDEELHAEVCYAEALLLKSLLIFMEDETLSSFLKSGLRIRSCYNIYKECHNILSGKHWQSSSTKTHFESGVKFGIGSFNLMISMLPTKVIKLLEFIGFSGEKTLGLNELESGYNLNGGLRQVLCAMTLLGYHLVIEYLVNNHDNVPELCEKIIDEQLKIYPNGIWFQYFNGRLQLIKGDLNASIAWYKKSWKSQNIWPQFHHLCFWELFWVYCLQLNWREAATYANYLLNESYWSRTIYSYQTAAILYMLGTDLTKDEKKKIDLLMRNGPIHKRRIAGKSLPMEKFAINKSLRYFQQNNYLVLPAIELLYLWNLFKVLKQKLNFAQQIYRLIERELEQWTDPSRERRVSGASTTTDADADATTAGLIVHYDYDNLALILLLKGSCLRVMNSPLQAMECLERVCTLEDKIVQDKYIVPFAIYEMALIVFETGDRIGALNFIQNIKKKYSGYPLESRLHFKMHSLLIDINDKLTDC